MVKTREKSVRSDDEIKNEISISHQLERLLKRHVKNTPATKIARNKFLFIKERLECPSLSFDLFFSFVCFCVKFDDCFLVFFSSKDFEDTWSLLDLVSITITSSEVSKSSFSLLSSKKTE